MATADQVKALIKSHAEGDETRFYAIAMQMAAQEARTGHTKLAQELRLLVDELRTHSAREYPSESKLVPLAQPRGELAGLLTVGYSKTRLAEMALDPEVQRRIERVLVEQRERARIQEHGFTPLRKLLLVGPPGTGKTMTASVLAGELGLPLFTIQRRVLNSFLQFLEQDASDSLILAATNHPALLDRALFRRFDETIEYRLPAADAAERVMKGRCEARKISQAGYKGREKAARSRGLRNARREAWRVPSVRERVLIRLTPPPTLRYRLGSWEVRCRAPSPPEPRRPHPCCYR